MAVPEAEPTTEEPHPETQRPGLIGMIDRFDAAWNTHDANRVMDFFAGDAIVKLVPPLVSGETGEYAGQDQIRGLVERFIPGFHIESSDHEMISGDTITWLSRASADAFRQMGADWLEWTSEATIQKGQIQSWVATFSDEAVSRLQAAEPAA